MRCPVCRAENAEEVSCRRCRADLSLMVAVEQARRAALAAASVAAASGDGALTVDQAWVAHDLRPGADSSRWLAVGYLLQRDFARALAHHQNAV